MDSEVTKVVRRSDFIDLLVKSILKEDESTFTFVREEILADGSYFILYQAQSNAILLEIQPNFTRISLKRLIAKCLEVQNHIDGQLFLVVLCTDKIPLSVESMLSSYPQNTLWKILNSTVWAEKCLVIDKEGISFSEDESKQNLDPLMVLALYFSNDEKQKQKLIDIGDSTMQLIHALIKGKN